MASETIKYAGLKLQVDGAAEFQKTMSEISSDLKLSQSELSKATAEYGKNSKEIEALTAQQKHLENSLSLNKDEQKALNEMIERASDKYGENSKEVDALKTKLNESEAAEIRIKKALEDVSKELTAQESGWTKLGTSLTENGEKLQKIGGKISDVGGALTKGVTAPLAAAAAGLVAVGAQFDDAYDKIRIGTGATGDALNGLTDDFKAVASIVPASFDDVSTAIADYNTRLDLSGKGLQELSEQTLNLCNITGADLSSTIESTSKTFNAFNLTSEEYGASLDYIFKVSQSTGIGVDRLQGNMAKFSPALKELGLGFTESATLMGVMDKAGVDVEASLGAMNKAVVNMAKSGVTDANEAIKILMENIKNAPTDMEATQTAMETFGAKGGVGMATAIREGKLSYEELIQTLNESGETINGTANETYDWAESFTVLKNQLLIALEPLAGQFFDAVNGLVPVFQKAVEWVTNLILKFTGLDENTQKMILMFAGIAAAIGPVISVIGTVTSAVGGAMSAFGAISSGIAAFTGAAAAGTTGVTALTGVLTVLTGPVGIAVAAIAGLTVAGVALYNHFSQELIPEIDHFGTGISDTTMEATKGFLDMNEQITRDLTVLSVTGGEVTEQMRDSIISNVSGMANETKTALEAAKEESLATLNTLLQNAIDTSNEEKQSIIENTANAYDEKMKKISDAEAEIKEIMQQASEEKRTLTDEEREIITKNQELIATEGIKHMTDNEREQKVLLEKMKDNASLISAQQAAEVVKSAVKQKEKTIAEAEEQYSKTLAEIIKQRDEVGSISEEQANTLIQEAKRQKDKTIGNVEEMHKKIVDEAQKQAAEHVDKVNWETGEILTKWDEFKRKATNKWNEIKAGATEAWNSTKENATRIWGEMTASVSQKIEDMKAAVSNKTSEIKTAVSDKWNEITSFLGNINLFDIGKNIIDGLANGISNAVDNVVNAAKNAATSAANAIKDFFRISSPSKLMIEYGGFIGKGLELGIKETGQDIANAAMKISNSVADNLQIDPSELITSSMNALENIQYALPGMESNISHVTQTQTARRSEKLPDIILTGNQFIVREESDIQKIAKEVIRQMKREVDYNSRIGGIALT